MTYISDTIQKESISKIMSLYITPSKKIFIDSEKLSQKDNEEISLDYDYTTIRQEDKLTKFYLIDSELFSTEEKIPSFDWKISNETKMIDNIKCQLATLNYKGRIWNAWFSPKYSFFSGPYIFDNLPGLIIEISDSKNHYNFKLIEINQKKYNIIIPKSLTVDSNSLKKLYLNYFENPFRKLKEKNHSNTQTFNHSNTGLRNLRNVGNTFSHCLKRNFSYSRSLFQSFRKRRNFLRRKKMSSDFCAQTKSGTPPNK